MTQTIDLFTAQAQRAVHTHHRRLQQGLNKIREKRLVRGKSHEAGECFVLCQCPPLHNGSGVKTPLRGSIWTFTSSLKIFPPSDGLLLTQLC